MPENKKVSAVLLVRNTAIIPAVVTIICLVPFVNKAFHMDDTLFIWAAKHIQTSPGNFYGFSVNWYGPELPMSKVTKNPPITCYYIALIGKLFGWKEAALHIAFLIPAAAMALGTYYLAGKFCSRPVLAACAAVLTPVFLVSSTNVMCDTMMLAFWVWAVFFWVRGIETNKCWNLFLAAVLISICALTKYFGIALLALLPAYSIMQKRKIGAELLFLLIPVIILAGYQLLTYKLYGRGLLLDATAYATKNSMSGGSQFLLKGLTGLLFTGGCIITVLFYSPLLWSRRVLAGSIVLIILLIIALSFVTKAGEFSVKDDGGNIKWGILVQIGLMALTGFSILALAGTDFRRNRNAESLLLLLWVFGTFIFAGFINWTINARSILPMAPAAGILLMRRIEQYKNSFIKAGNRGGIWPLVPAAVVALLVCWADYTWANTARSAAAAIHKSFENSGRTIWFQGHWGFQYYMEAAGGKAIDFENLTVAKEDVIVIPLNNTNIIFPPEKVAYLDKVLQFAPYQKLATMNLRLSAGFYAADAWGQLPFAAGAVEPEKYYVYIVK